MIDTQGEIAYTPASKKRLDFKWRRRQGMDGKEALIKIVDSTSVLDNPKRLD